MSAHPPVVLVHGIATSSARTWGDNGWIDLLADAGRTAIPLDQMGHGTADRPTDPAAYDRLEDDLLERFPAEPVDAIGFSLGARTLLTIASAHPERFPRGVPLPPPLPTAAWINKPLPSSALAGAQGVGS